MADMYFNTKDRDWGEFYNSLGRTDLSPVAQQPSGELTTRSVKTVAIDPFTGQPISAGGPNPATLAALNANMVGRGQPARMGTASPEVAAARLQPGSEGLPLNPTGQYNAGNPLVLSALRAQQSANPAVAAATAVAQGGIKPSWANSPGFGPKFPVAATPEIRAAYADMVAGKPGSQKVYAELLADQAGKGNIGSSYSGGGGSGGGSGGGVPSGQPVKIATGKTATSGQTYQQGANGAGKPYTYQVQPNGSIKNLTTGRITAPATR